MKEDIWAKEIEDLNKIIELTSDQPKPSGTTAADTDAGGDVETKDSTMLWKTVQTEGDAAMASSGISSVSMVGDAEVIPMETEEKKKKKKGDDAAREGVPDDSTGFETPSASCATAENKAAIVDLTEKVAEVDKPAGKPAEKKMPNRRNRRHQRRRQCLAPKLPASMRRPTRL